MSATDVRLLDESLTLMAGGDDCGVGLHCRTCWTGGAPVAYYTVLSTGYPEGSGVPNVESIAALLSAGVDHLASHSV